jgi:hypothetical protein
MSIGEVLPVGHGKKTVLRFVPSWRPLVDVIRTLFIDQVLNLHKILSPVNEMPLNRAYLQAELE